MAWSEDRIHLWLMPQSSTRWLAGSRGHDAAVLRELAGRPVVCVDQTVEGVHFLSNVAPKLIGRKAAARALSDLAATAARPRAVFLALCAPRERDERWLRAVIEGVRSIAREHGADLLGGDLCAAPAPAHLSVTAIGEVDASAKPVGRDRARAGDLVVLTGPVGGSILGRHLAIVPRIDAGRELARAGAHAMMDVSDGLAWDLFRLARSSSVRIDLDLERVPVHDDVRALAKKTGRSPIWHALHDGEDHDLVATIAARDLERAHARLRKAAPELATIGRVRAGSGLHLCDGRGESKVWRKTQGAFEHGA